jgi:fructose-1-phosphate kinase PfkB-like protein
MPSSIWIFGNAVQDVTVEVDVDRLAREQQDVEQWVRFDIQPLIRCQTRLEVQVGLERFATTVHLPALKEESNGFYTLKPGEKYTLAGSIESVTGLPTHETPMQRLLLHGEGVTWGGGGLNVARFLRQLAPQPQQIPLRYTDMALGPSLDVVVDTLEKLVVPRMPFEKIQTLRSAVQPEDCAAAEERLGRVATALAKAGADSCLDVYLASLPVRPGLYRPPAPTFRRNLVLSRFYCASRETHDKIIFRSNFPRLEGLPAEQAISRLLSAYGAEEVGAVLLNSIKDPALFHAGYQFYLQAQAKNPNVLGILAMTKPMQAFTGWLRERHGQDKFPPFILIFNQDEALSFASAFQSGLKPMMSASRGMPDFKAFGEIAQVLRAQFPIDPMPRIYITLGAQGSLGVDSTGEAVYVACYTRPHDTILDTNACGDAYCAAITLLEWAKRNGYADLTNIDMHDAEARVKEMQHFMAVATAAAYCKATDRYGRSAGARVTDVLMHTHLASDRLLQVHDLAKGLAPEWASHGWIGHPPDARIFAVTPTLARLLA